MRTLAKLAATIGMIGVVATTAAVPASAFEVWIGHPHHHPYYNYYGRGIDPNVICQPGLTGLTLQGGVCKPYRGSCPPGWTIQHGFCSP